MQERIDLNPYLVTYYNAFCVISSSRQSGMGMGYIGYLTITDFLNEEGYTGLERQECRKWIQTIDRVFVKLHSDKDKVEREKKNPPKPAPRGKRG